MAKKDKSKSQKPKTSSEYTVNKTVAKHAAEKKSSSNPVPAKTAPVNAANPKHRNRKKIAAVVVLIILLGLLYLYLTYGSIPSAILSGSQLNSLGMEALVVHALYSNNMVGLSYSGNVTVNNNDPYIQIGFSKYYNDTRTSLSLTQFPAIKNESVIVIAINNDTTGYACQKLWNSYGTQNNTYTCSVANNGQTSGVVATALGRIVDLSSLSDLQTHSYGIGFWNLQPCYTVSGTGSIMVNGTMFNQTGYIPSSLNFTACVSAQYDIPLTLKGTIIPGNNESVHFEILENSMNFTTTQAQVTALPQQS